MDACYNCGTTEKELRPYGPGGKPVCFDCAFATPEAQAQTEGAFDALLDAVIAVSPVVFIGTEEGPH